MKELNLGGRETFGKNSRLTNDITLVRDQGLCFGAPDCRSDLFIVGFRVGTGVRGRQEVYRPLRVSILDPAAG
jgi:hypothetical protein